MYVLGVFVDVFAGFVAPLSKSRMGTVAITYAVQPAQILYSGHIVLQPKQRGHGIECPRTTLHIVSFIPHLSYTRPSSSPCLPPRHAPLRTALFGHLLGELGVVLLETIADALLGHNPLLNAAVDAAVLAR